MRSTMLLSTVAAMIVSAGVVVAGAGSDTRVLPAIERTELEFQQSKNVYEAIHALRHDWLVRGEGQRESPAVFIAMPCTKVNCLRWLESDLVEEIRYLSPYEPGSGWPPTNDNGSIVVTLRTRELQSRVLRSARAHAREWRK